MCPRYLFRVDDLTFFQSEIGKFISLEATLQRVEEEFNKASAKQQTFKELQNLTFDTFMESSFTESEALNKLECHILKKFHQVPFIIGTFEQK